MRRLLLSICICTMLSSCSGDDDVRCAVNSQLTLYPKATLQDLYKGFVQAEFGPEHIISDTTSAGKYLDFELLQKATSTILYEPIGVDSAFFRVHLSAVQSGKITRDELFDAFVGSFRKIGQDEIASWKEKWSNIENTIGKMDLQLIDYDLDHQKIDSILSSGYYAVHHSNTFRETYNPHYRIVRKDIFYEKLYEKLYDKLR